MELQACLSPIHWENHPAKSDLDKKGSSRGDLQTKVETNILRTIRSCCNMNVGWIYSPPSNSHHPDCCISTKESL